VGSSCPEEEGTQVVALVNGAMDVQGVGGRAAAALHNLVFVHCVCGWVPRVQKILPVYL
jgi:hypothetical protein